MQDRLQVDWSIRTITLTYWMDCNGPLFCQVALALNRLHRKRIAHSQPGCQLGMMQQTLYYDQYWAIIKTLFCI